MPRLRCEREDVFERQLGGKSTRCGGSVARRHTGTIPSCLPDTVVHHDVVLLRHVDDISEPTALKQRML